MNKNNKVKITVSMPAYNAVKYIKAAIDSVLAQDYDDFELLIVDDGSTDGTEDIIARYKNHPKVRIYRNDRNLGAGVAKNQTVRLARGEYFSFCDDDDLMMPGNLKTLSRFLDTHPDVGLVYPKALIIEVDSRNKLLGNPYALKDNFDDGWDILRNTVCQGGAMVRKKILVKAGRYDEIKCYAPGDWAIWLRLAEITKIKYLKSGIYYTVIRRDKCLTKKQHGQYESYILEKIFAAIKRRYGVDFKG